MLAVKSLNQYYGGSHILRDVAFEARLKGCVEALPSLADPT